MNDACGGANALVGRALGGFVDSIRIHSNALLTSFWFHACVAVTACVLTRLFVSCGFRSFWG